MDAKILNLYNEYVAPNKNFKAGNGNFFSITISEKRILFDAGHKRQDPD